MHSAPNRSWLHLQSLGTMSLCIPGWDPRSTGNRAWWSEGVDEINVSMGRTEQNMAFLYVEGQSSLNHRVFNYGHWITDISLHIKKAVTLYKIRNVSIDLYISWMLTCGPISFNAQKRPLSLLNACSTIIQTPERHLLNPLICFCVKNLSSIALNIRASELEQSTHWVVYPKTW